MKEPGTKAGSGVQELGQGQIRGSRSSAVPQLPSYLLSRNSMNSLRSWPRPRSAAARTCVLPLSRSPQECVCHAKPSRMPRQLEGSSWLSRNFCSSMPGPPFSCRRLAAGSRVCEARWERGPGEQGRETDVRTEGVATLQMLGAWGEWRHRSTAAARAVRLRPPHLHACLLPPRFRLCMQTAPAGPGPEGQCRSVTRVPTFCLTHLGSGGGGMGQRVRAGAHARRAAEPPSTWTDGLYLLVNMAWK